MKLSIDVKAEQLSAVLKAVSKQVPFAAASALTATAKEIEKAMQEEMRRVFDRPTPYTLRSLRTLPATKETLTATVKLKDDPSKSIPAAKALGHQFEGQERQRAIKRAEGALRRIGMLGTGEIAVPGAGAQLDAYGNMARSQITQILSWFQAFGEQGYKANSTTKTRAKRATGRVGRSYGKRYFYKRTRPGRGIYEATRTGFGSAIKPVLMFVRTGVYTPRLDFKRVADTVYAETFERVFAEKLEQAIRTAR